MPIEIQQGYVGINKLKVARSFERQIRGKFCELNNISTANAISSTVRTESILKNSAFFNWKKNENSQNSSKVDLIWNVQQVKFVGGTCCRLGGGSGPPDDRGGRYECEQGPGSEGPGESRCHVCQPVSILRETRLLPFLYAILLQVLCRMRN